MTGGMMSQNYSKLQQNKTYMKLPSLLQDSAGLPIEHVLLLMLLMMLMLMLLMLLMLMLSRVTGSTHRLLLPAVWAEGSQASQGSAALCGWLVPNTALPPPLLHLAAPPTHYTNI